MDATSGLLLASGTVSAIDQFLKHRQRQIDKGEIPLDQKITQHVRSFVKSLSRENSRESTPIRQSIQMEEIYEDKEVEDIINDIPLETRPALFRQSNIKNPVKPSLLSTIFRNMEKKQTPIQVMEDIVEISEDEEFQKFVSKIIKFISHELEVNKEDKVYQNHKNLHKKLSLSLNNQHKMEKK